MLAADCGMTQIVVALLPLKLFVRWRVGLTGDPDAVRVKPVWGRTHGRVYRINLKGAHCAAMVFSSHTGAAVVCKR